MVDATTAALGRLVKDGPAAALVVDLRGKVARRLAAQLELRDRRFGALEMSIRWDGVRARLKLQMAMANADAALRLRAILLARANAWRQGAPPALRHLLGSLHTRVSGPRVNARLDATRAHVTALLRILAQPKRAGRAAPAR